MYTRLQFFLPDILQIPFIKKLHPSSTSSIPHHNRPRQNKMFFSLSIHPVLLNVKVLI